MPINFNYGWEEEVIDPEEELKRTSDQDKGPETESITDIEKETQDMGDQYEEDLGMEEDEVDEDADPDMGGESYRRRKYRFYGIEEYTEDLGVDTGSDDANTEDVTIEETPPAEEVTEEVAPEATNLDVTAEVSVQPAEVTEEEVKEDAVDEETQEMDASAAVENWANKIGIYGLENEDPVTIHVETGEIDKEITLEGSNVSINDGGDNASSSDDQMPEEIDDGTGNDGNGNAEGGDNGGKDNNAGNESLSALEYLIGL